MNLSLSPQSIGAALVSALAVGALLLAAMGLFGVSPFDPLTLMALSRVCCSWL